MPLANKGLRLKNEEPTIARFAGFIFILIKYSNRGEGRSFSVTIISFATNNQEFMTKLAQVYLALTDIFI
jgi:hypothetical protein